MEKVLSGGILGEVNRKLIFLDVLYGIDVFGRSEDFSTKIGEKWIRMLPKGVLEATKRGL